MPMDCTGTADGVLAKSRRKGPRPPTLRSRVGNGKELIAGADGNSAEYREYQDLVDDFTSHLGGNPTITQAALIEEAAGLIYWCRRERLKLLQGGEINTTVYCTATNTLRRYMADLGLAHRLKDVTLAPTPAQYLATLEGKAGPP
jgi:hypothetical protein